VTAAYIALGANLGDPRQQLLAAVDALARTAPWGMIVGVLVGFAVSIWMTVRSARRMQAEFERELGPPRDLPPDDEED